MNMIMKTIYSLILSLILCATALAATNDIALIRSAAVSVDTNATLRYPTNFFWVNGLGLNVKLFGAVGNNVHDDYIAVQAAINAAATNGGTVYFPAGKYRLTNSLTIPKLAGETVISTLCLKGEGSFLWDNVNAGTKLIATGNFPVLTAEYTRMMRISDLRFEGPGTAGSVGLWLKNYNSHSRLDNVGFGHFETAVSVGSTNVTMINNDYVTYNKCEFLYCNEALRINYPDAYNHKFHDCYFQYMGTVFHSVINPVSSLSQGSVGIYDSYLDPTNGCFYIEGIPLGVGEMKGCLWEVSTPGTMKCLLNLVDSPGNFDCNFVIEGNTFNWSYPPWVTNTVPFIRLPSRGAVTLVNNQFNIYKPVIEARNTHSSAPNLVCINNKWLQQPAIWSNDTNGTPGNVFMMGDVYNFGEMSDASDTFPNHNLTFTSGPWNYKGRRIGYYHDLDKGKVMPGSLLINDKPAIDEPTFQYAITEGMNEYASLTNYTLNAISGDPIVTLNKTNGLYSGMNFTYQNSTNIYWIRTIIGGQATLYPTPELTTNGAAVTFGTPAYQSFFFSQVAEPGTNVTSRNGDLALSRNAILGEPVFWYHSQYGFTPVGQQGFISTITNAPTWIGQQAIVGTNIYMAIGTSTTADWIKLSP